MPKTENQLSVGENIIEAFFVLLDGKGRNENENKRKIEKNANKKNQFEN